MRHLHLTLVPLLLLLLCFALGCTFDIPGAPIWTVEVIVPFSQRTYRLSEMVVDSAKLKKDGYGLLYGPDNEILQFEYWDSLDYQQIEDRMIYGSSDVGSFRNNITQILMSIPNADSTIVFIREVSSDSIGPVASFNLPLITDTLYFEDYNWIQVQFGWIDVQICNDFSFPVDNISVTLTNPDDGVQIGNVIFNDSIPGKGKLTKRMPVNENLLHNVILMTMSGQAEGTYRDIFIPRDDNLRVVVNLSEIYADSVDAIIQEQNFTAYDTLEYDDPNQLVTTTIESGWTYFILRNYCPTEVIVATCFSNIIDTNGDTLSTIIKLNPGTSDAPSQKTDSTNLAGCMVQMDRDNQSLFVVGKASTVSTLTEYITMNGDQGIESEYWTGELVFSVLTGILDSVHFDLSLSEVEFEIPDNAEEAKDSIHFQEHRIILETNNETPKPALINVSLEAANDFNDTTIFIIDRIEAGLDSLEFQLLFLPNIVRYEGWARLGARFFPEYEDDIVTYRKTDGVHVDVRVKSEMKLTVGEATLKTDPERLEDEMDLSIENANLHIILTNSIPVGGTVSLMMGTDTTNMSELISLDLPVGDIENYRASAEEKSYVINLTEADFNIINQPNVYTRQTIVLHSTEGDTVWLYGADSLTVRAHAVIDYIVDLGGNNE